MATANLNLKYGKFASLKDKLLSNIVKNGECWELQAVGGSHGYPSISFSGKRELSHRASFKLFHGDIPNGHFVLHKCDNRKCCNPNHLFSGTQKENIQDCMNKKRDRKKTKLSIEQVIEIRILTMENKLGHGFVAKNYGVTRPTVSMIHLQSRRGNI